MTGSDSAIPLLTGIMTRLKGWSALTAIVGQKIYSDVPQATDSPYVTVETMPSKEFDAKDFTGMQFKVRVMGFSRKQSRLEALQIRAAVIECLERQESNITVSGFNLVQFVKGSLFDIITSDDGVTKQSIAEFNVIIT